MKSTVSTCLLSSSNDLIKSLTTEYGPPLYLLVMNSERTTDDEMDHILELSSLSRSTSLMLGDAALKKPFQIIYMRKDLLLVQVFPLQPTK